MPSRSCASATYDLVFLDEMMPGMGGLRTLAGDQGARARRLPVVMITKNEEESLMEEAIGGQDQRLPDQAGESQPGPDGLQEVPGGKRITGAAVSRGLHPGVQRDLRRTDGGSRTTKSGSTSTRDWSGWGLELDAHPELGLKQTLLDQIRECNLAFGKYVERNYRDWVEQDDGPPVALAGSRGPFRAPGTADRAVGHASSSSTACGWTSGWCSRSSSSEYFDDHQGLLLQHPADRHAVLTRTRIFSGSYPVRSGAALPGALGEERG
ncbi:MAG: hypothetical protein MZV64_74150 [Ignavibacteriales bacterium]|nr:hypothetical protein [Ignavibacteriales bacterium]